MIPTALTQPVIAGRTVFSQRSYFAVFVATALLLAGAFVYVPVKTIPGNDFAFQLSLFDTGDILLMAFLSALSSLLITLNIYRVKKRLNARSVGGSGAGGMAAVAGAIFGTAACSSCVAAIFGFLGAPAVFFLIDARNYIVAGALIILVVSLFFAAKAVNRSVACEIDCNSKAKK